MEWAGGMWRCCEGWGGGGGGMGGRLDGWGGGMGEPSHIHILYSDKHTHSDTLNHMHGSTGKHSHICRHQHTIVYSYVL